MEIKIGIDTEIQRWGGVEKEIEIKNRDTDREIEKRIEMEVKRERERKTEYLLHPTLCIKPLCFAFDQMSSWYNAAAYGWSGSYGSCYGRRRGSWGGESEVRSEVEWFCQKCGTGNWWSRTDSRHCASVTNDDADAPKTSALEKIAVLEKTLAGAGDDEPILAGKRVLEKELEKLQRKLNGPNKTAKHIEAKQNCINRESKRVESESAKLAEWQESLRARKETLRVAFEEIKILRDDLLREGESMDKNKSHFMSPENTEESRILEQRELASAGGNR